MRSSRAASAMASSLTKEDHEGERVEKELKKGAVKGWKRESSV